MKSFDPSRTRTLQKAYARRLRKEYNVMTDEIVRWFEDPNNWIHEEVDEIAVNAGGLSHWSFAPKSQVLGAFTKWLNKLVGKGDVEVASDGFVSEAFDKGAKQAESYAPTEIAPGVSGVFRSGTMIERLKIVKTQAKNNIRGLTEKIKRSVVDRLSDGLIKGEPPHTVARDIAKTTKGMTKVAAERIARTEAIRAHAEGALDRMESMGVTHVGANVEFVATKLKDGSFEKRVCPRCRALDGIVFPIENAHGIIPVHPNCRCTWVPNFDKVNKEKVRAAVQRAVKAGEPKKSKKIDPAIAANEPPKTPSGPGPAIQDSLDS